MFVGSVEGKHTSKQSKRRDTDRHGTRRRLVNDRLSCIMPELERHHSGDGM